MNWPGPLDEPQRRYEAGIRQCLYRGLLVLVQIDDTTRCAEEHAHHAVAAGRSSGDASAAIYVQHVHPDSFRRLVPLA